MTNVPSVPEIITVNSEELQTLIRDLLPSQRGFGSELQATNVITPIIDLTATAEGSILRQDLQSALAFGSQTTFEEAGTSSVIANSPGFYKIVFGYSIQSSSVDPSVSFSVTDGLSTKTIWQVKLKANATFQQIASDSELIVWLATGESISAVSVRSGSIISGSIRQIADPEGKFVSPNGFPL